MAEQDSFQHLVNANLDVLRARACMVLDMSLYDTSEPPALRWSVDLPVRETPPSLTLRGPAFQAFVTRVKKDLEPPHPPGWTHHPRARIRGTNQQRARGHAQRQRWR